MASKTERFGQSSSHVPRTERFQTANSNLGATLRQSASFISGKQVPNYSLLYLDPTIRNQQGTHENIVLPNVTMGRGERCHVRYDDNYGTVSREHASISYGENNFVLNHNPNASNPTFVNGNEVMAPVTLNNGDEIQLSSNGPRLRFMSGETTQAAKMGFTSRLGSAVGQAIRPYKKAVIILSVFLVGALGLGGFSLFQNKQLSSDLKSSSFAIESLNQDISSKSSEITKLESKVKSISNKNSAESRKLAEQLEQSKMELEASRQQLASTQRMQRENQAKINRLEKEKEEALNNEAESTPTPLTTGASLNKPASAPAPAETAAASGDAPKATFSALAGDNVFVLIARSIELMSKAGFKKLDARRLIEGEENDGLWSGVAFLTEDGKLVTARQNIQPWRFYKPESEDFKEFYQAINELETEYGNVNVLFELVGKDGKLQMLETKEVIMNESKDELIEQRVFNSKSKKDKLEVKVSTDQSTNWAYFPIVGTKGNIKVASKKDLKKVQEGDVVNAIGYAVDLAGNVAQNELAPLMMSGDVAFRNQKSNTLEVSKVIFPEGSLGGPVFMNVKNEFKAIGIVGSKSTGITSTIILINNLR